MKPKRYRPIKRFLRYGSRCRCHLPVWRRTQLTPAERADIAESCRALVYGPSILPGLMADLSKVDQLRSLHA